VVGTPGQPDGRKQGTDKSVSTEKAVNPTDSSVKGKPIVRWGHKAQGSFQGIGRMARPPEKKKEER